MAITNKAIIELYKAENGLPLDMPLYTWAVWHNMGYRVRKGEVSRHRVPLWKYTDKQGKSDTSEQEAPQGQNRKCFMKTMYLFEREQVEKITAL